MGRWIASLAVILVMAAPAAAEENEVVVLGSGGLRLPGYENGTGGMSFRTAGWDSAVSLEYGVFHSLFVGIRFGFGMGVGVVEGYKGDDPPVTASGDLVFDTRFFHPQALIRWKVFSGYDLAPHIEVAGGFSWMEATRGEVVDENGLRVSDAADFGRQTWSVEAGLIVDYRLLNLVVLGAGVTYTLVGDDLLRGVVRFPVRAGIYWF